MIKRLLPLLIFLLLIVFLYIGLGLNPKKLPSPLIGKPLPNVELTDFKTGKALSSQDTLKHQVSLLNVWASWCATCAAEHDQLMKLAQLNEVQIIGVNYKDSVIDGEAFLKKLGNPYHQILFDPKGRLGLELGVYATPESFIVDKNGLIQYKQTGEITAGLIQSDILPLIKKLK